MPLIVQQWDSNTAQQQLYDRLVLAQEYRLQIESQWAENEQILYNAVGYRDAMSNIPFNSIDDGDDTDDDAVDLGVNYAFKDWKFLHAQMSANPPTVMFDSASSDLSDRTAAKNAESTANHLRINLNIQEVQDLCNAKVLSKGTGWIKTVWDSTCGKVADFNKKTNEISMKGDIRLYSPSTWDVWIDPDAKTWADVKYIFERHQMTIEDAKFRFPNDAERLEKVAVNGSPDGRSSFWQSDDSKRRRNRQLVAVMEYYEVGYPTNGMAGRHCYCMEDGSVLGEVRPNPHPNALLPYHILTDVDVEDVVYGKASLEYAINQQDALNRMDGFTLDNVRNHAKKLLAVPEGAEVMDDAFNDSPEEYMKYTGNIPPSYVQPPGQMADFVALRETLVAGIDHVFGVNASMEGRIERETSGFAQQTAINAGNMTRRRLFNKYQKQVECMYNHLLMLVIKHWSEKRMIKSSGKERAMEIAYLKGADIATGWDMTAKYGQSYSLDPETRREEINQLKPDLKEAGLSPREILQLYGLNETRYMMDRLSMSKDREREVFDEMIAKFDVGTPVYIKPEELQDYEARLEFSYDYLESADFRDHPDELKELLRRRVNEMRQLLLQEAQPGGAVPGEQPAPAPAAPAGGAVPAGAPAGPMGMLGM